MGFTELFDNFLSAVGYPEVHAEAPPKDDEKSEDKDESKDEEKDEDKSDDSDDKEGGDDEQPEEEEPAEEEEEEEEPEDPKPKLEEECARSSQCAPAKHHYDECVERVHKHEEKHDQNSGAKEDCVEEFFHLQHCATQCAAPKLFKILK